MNNNKMAVFFSVVMVFCLVNLTAFNVRADDLGSIDKNESFDIYFGNGTGNESFVVKRVKIVRIDQINNLEFLVFINDAGFNAKGKEGYILFSTLNAIVPSSTFTINGFERYKQN